MDDELFIQSFLNLDPASTFKFFLKSEESARLRANLPERVRAHVREFAESGKSLLG